VLGEPHVPYLLEMVFDPYHLALSAARIHGTGLEFKHNKGGVSLADSTDAETPVSQSPTYATHAGPRRFRRIATALTFSSQSL
jgi:hypothetical protein